MTRPRKNTPKAQRLIAEQAIESLERALDGLADPATDEKSVQQISVAVSHAYHRWQRIQARKRTVQDHRTDEDNQ